jgi:NADH-quinone oxidoreductase subunit N
MELLPDIVLVVIAFGILLGDLLLKNRGPAGALLLFHATWLSLAALLAFTLWYMPSDTAVHMRLYAVTPFGWWLRRVFLLSALLAVFLSRAYFTTGADGHPPLGSYGEFLYLLLFSTIGMVTVVSARDLLTLFVGLELATVPLYILAAYNKHQPASGEAGAKFILFGSLSTAFMLFGYSYLYGVAGSLYLDAIATYVGQHPGDPYLWAGILFILAAVGFKIGLFPFHMWVPDVYDGAPAPTTAFLAVSSKTVAIAFLYVLLAGPFAPMRVQLEPWIIVLSAATMLVGNLGALRQGKLRRFMGYSAIAQGGYLLMGLVGASDLSGAAIVYYLVIYAVSNYAAFHVFSLVGEQRGESMESLRGLSRESPALAGLLALSMFSLAGIPPAAGFTGKFMLFANAAESGHYAFVIYAALNSTISLYYYLLILKEAYITPVDPDAGRRPLGHVAGLARLVLILLAVAQLALGLCPAVSSRIHQTVNSVVISP